ncbi:tyrosine-type recombinase/integrase [Microlunatus antarcticus]|uniref:Integrase n=1 Tax=Microlunatus antarcticus TaxID=53388 RepID=A0A7W5JT04_9ACTN|nr:integrase [Microlunatus antarcticus]
MPQRREEGLWKRSTVRGAERWRARAYSRGFDGVRREVTRFGRTKREATTSVEAALRELHQVGDVTMTPATPLVRAGELWLAQIGRRESGMSQRTLELYRAMFERHISSDGSSLRGLSLAQANDPQRLRIFLQRLADASGTGTAKTAKTVLSNILGQAVDNGTLQMNAMRQVRPVRSETVKVEVRDHRRALTREERDAVITYADGLAGAQGLDPRTVRKWEAVADLLAVMAGTGVRLGEAASLRWEHIDLETGRVRLHGTKTAAARRALNLPAWLTARLVARSARTGTDGLVFPSPAHLSEPEQPWERRNLDRCVREVLDGAGLPWAVAHSLRRTVASLLHESGQVSLVQIADQLGHADPAMTARVYLGRDFDGDRSALAALL